MKDEPISQGSQTGGKGLPSSALPDVNAETYPYERVQHLLDQTADFHMFAIPDQKQAKVISLTPDAPDDFFGINGGYGLAINNVLHRFDSVVPPTVRESGFRVAQSVGESTGTFRCRWMFSPDDFAWAPGREPPPLIYDPWHSQRFIMLDGQLTFGDRGECGGYGVGRTFPVMVDGKPQLVAAAMGNIISGSGAFNGLRGTYTLTGAILPTLGFLGNVTLRILDPNGIIRSDREISSLTPITDPDPASAFLVFRGEKKDRHVKTTYGPPPGGNQVALVTPALMRATQYNYTDRGGGGLHTDVKVNQVVCNYVATVFFNLFAPPGTAEAPVPFSTQELYTFIDDDGRSIGTISADIILGESFDLRLPAAPGQAGVRFAGFGPIRGGTGQFTGVQGMLTVNSLIGIAPHALSLMHVLHILDPEGKFRTAMNGCRC